MEKYQFGDAERKILERLPSPLAVYQFVEKHVYTLTLSVGFCELFGYQDHAEAYRVMEEDICYNTHPDDVARVSDAIYRFITESGPYEVIFRGRKYHGQDYRIVHGVGRHVFTESGVRLAYVMYTDEGAYTGRDDTQASALNRAFNFALHEESILKASYYDYLTGLPSMTHFFELTPGHREAILAAGGQPVLLYVDLCGMKHFNIRYGFAEGDALLKSFAECLSAAFPGDICSHFGADHFVVVSREEGLESKINLLFEKTRRLHGGRSLPVHIGIYPHRLEPVAVTVACDRAKYICDELKNNYASCYAYYNLTRRAEADQRQYILENLDRAIENEWIQVYYQGIERVETGKLTLLEALARWIDPVRGMISPGDFIPVLSRYHLMHKLDLYMLEQVCRGFGLRREAGLPLIPVTVNVSAQDFDYADVVGRFNEILGRYGLDPENIIVEITEQDIALGTEHFKSELERFRKSGYKLWIDDFGSGYSSLNVFSQYDIDRIKFDMELLRHLDDNNGANRRILRAFVRICREMGVHTLAEGVETVEQLEFLREIGCEMAQGFYFYKPLSMETSIRNHKLCGPSIPCETDEERSAYAAAWRSQD